MKKKGFTLIELLAVIVILAVVSLVAIPIILGIIKNVQRQSFKASVQGAYKAVELYNQLNKIEQGISINNSNLSIKNNNFKSGEFIKTNNDFITQNITDGNFCANGNVDNLVITDNNCTDEEGNVSLVVNVIKQLSSSITVSALTLDDNSDIKTYQYSIDGQTWITTRDTSYTFTKLKSNTEYEARVKLRTEDISEPTFNLNPTTPTKTAKLTILFPEGENFKYSYSIDSCNSWIDVSESSVTIDVNDNITVTGRVIDMAGDPSANKKYKSITLTNIDNINPTININPATVTIKEGQSYDVMTGVTTADDKSGILSTEASMVNTTSLKCGDHLITYTVTDGAENVSQATRTLHVNMGSDTSNANSPTLDSVMIPVVWNGQNWIKAETTQDEWYNYNEFKWANAVTVKASGTQTRSYYQNAAAGTIINMNDINTMWVWIPRYEYKMNSTSLSEISVNFIAKTATSATSGYIIHPAFKFGTINTSGMWVAKFEASGSTTNLTIIPNTNSLGNINLSTMFTATRNMESTYVSNYGFTKSTIDTHMMKNMEWGAVAYLSNSKYGKYKNTKYIGANKEVYINNYYNSSTWAIITGCSSGGPSTLENTTSCSYTYDKELTGTGASTTGTIYGIYDMNGGKWELVMANMKNSSGTFYASNSGFTSAPESKYYDIYAYSASIYTDYSARGLNGDATKETVEWNGDYARLTSNDGGPWVVRGGTSAKNTVGGIFSFGRRTAETLTDNSFRPILLFEE